MIDLPSLNSIHVGDCCFTNTQELKLIGLKELETVKIGKTSFVKCPYDPQKDGIDPNRRFYLKDCDKLKELKIGYWSFSDYSMCEIENVPSLEVIEMGELNEDRWNFYHASLELKSCCDGMK